MDLHQISVQLQRIHSLGPRIQQIKEFNCIYSIYVLRNSTYWGREMSNLRQPYILQSHLMNGMHNKSSSPSISYARFALADRKIVCVVRLLEIDRRYWCNCCISACLCAISVLMPVQVFNGESKITGGLSESSMGALTSVVVVSAYSIIHKWRYFIFAFSFLAPPWSWRGEQKRLSDKSDCFWNWASVSLRPVGSSTLITDSTNFCRVANELYRCITFLDPRPSSTNVLDWCSIFLMTYTHWAIWGRAVFTGFWHGSFAWKSNNCSHR